MKHLNDVSRRGVSALVTALTLTLVVFAATTARAQTTTFTYQGRFSDSTVAQPTNGTYDFQFAVYDALTSGAQQPQASPITVTRSGVSVTNGVFTLQLDFTAAAFPGADRFLEIRGKKPTDTSYTTLQPRQPITSIPYAIRSLSAATADTAITATTATTATNAQQLGGVAGSQFTQNDSQAFIRNQTTQQTADFKISGTGAANIFNATTQYNIGGSRAFIADNLNNVFAGFSAGTSNTTGSFNSFFGRGAGQNNTTGAGNSFVGTFAGFFNTTGNSNSFFGRSAGEGNTDGLDNSFVGAFAGVANTTGSFNSFVGRSAGQGNTTGSFNVFFGTSAGISNSTGGTNSFFGASAGRGNTTGFNNSFVGREAGRDNTTGNSNSFVGASAGLSNTFGIQNSFFGNQAGLNSTTGYFNSFFGNQAGLSNTTGDSNAFFGNSAGAANTTGTGNVFVGYGAGRVNSTASNNSFFGASAGYYNTTGVNNSIVGYNAGQTNTTGSNLTLIGNGADVGSNNLTFASAVGAGVTVNSSNSVVLGRAADTVRIPGNLIVTGSIVGATKNFKIDHPLDPLNKTLTYTSIESPDMMNIYNGNITTDGRGEAVVQMPAYFEALNKDFRYQLTVIGQFAQAIVLEKVAGNHFKIKTDKPNIEVSWQVTGIRHDAYANENRILVEEDKPENERGMYLYPKGFNQPDKKSVVTIGTNNPSSSTVKKPE